MASNRPIAVFDSGVGGISILRKLTELLPNENYIYFGDSKNAPYGSRSHDDIRRLTFESVDKLVSLSAKAVVIACNTATSVAIDGLREHYGDLPIIGVEPAIKPAVSQSGARVLVMATPATLSEERFAALMERYAQNSTVHLLPCHRLAHLIEQGHTDDDVVRSYLGEILAPYVGNVSSVVLGCTHYPFVQKSIKAILGDVEIFDGANGTAREVKRRLACLSLLNDSSTRGTLDILTSGDAEQFEELCRRLLEL